MKSKSTLRKTRLSVFLLLLLTSVIASAQTGSIEGTALDKKTHEALPGVTITIEGTAIGASAGIDGSFAIANLKTGKYTLRVSYISYNPVVMQDVRVEAGKSTKVTIEMSENTVALEGVTVTGVRKTNTEVAMINTTRMSPLVSIAVSGQQILRSQDRDASEVIKRLPGTTIIDDRFIVVRGLSQRYNAVWLNNAATPSSEADAKAFSFDVIPATMIENMIIVKSPAPELPADFSGGFVKINTVNIPEKDSYFASTGIGIGEGTTNKPFLKYSGSSTDWLAVDNGFRDLPAEMPAHLNSYELASNPEIRNRISTLGQKLNKTWLPASINAAPDQRLSLGFNKRIKTGSHTFGNVTSLTYSNTYNSDRLSNNTYSIYDYRNDVPSYIEEFYDNQFTNTVKAGILHNWSWSPSANHKIEFRNLLNQIGMNRVSEREGREWNNNGRYIKSTELRYMNRTVYSGQLAGDHSFGAEGNLKIDWVAGYSLSTKKEPDLKRTRYIRSESDTSTYFLLFADHADLSSQSQMWLDLEENVKSAAVNITRKLDINGFRPELKAGLYLENKSRQFSARNFGYSTVGNNSEFAITPLTADKIFTNENINLTNGIKLTEITSPSDSYQASNNQLSGYFSARLPLLEKLSLYTGLRIEKNNQTLKSYRQGTTIPVNVVRDSINVFPSANLAFNLNEKNILRAAYGLSVNRPEFRELAPFYFVDFDLNAGIYGNPGIRQAYIQNFDLRFEHYPSPNETFNLGAFYKSFSNPIEMVIMGTSPTQYSFDNVKSAYSYGLETDIRKSLGFISGAENFSLILNAALVKSKVSFDENDLNRNRSLQGQSPYMVNAGLFYYNDNNGLMITALYNVSGKRIVAVGRPSPNEWEDIPNIYEMPRNLIDLALSKKINKRIEIKAGIKDILNEPVKLQQNINTTVDMADLNGGTSPALKEFNRTQVLKSFNPGRYITLGITWKL